jgi:hypothetical protein
MRSKNDLKNINNQDRLRSLEKKKKNSLKTILFKGLLFIFCAIPGLFLFLIYSLWIAASIFTPKMENPPLLLTPLLIATGIVLMLIGTGKLKEIKYIIVFLSIPISFIIYVFLAERRLLGIGNRTYDIAFFLVLVLFYVNFLIKLHYQKKHERDGINKAALSDTNRPQEKKEVNLSGTFFFTFLLYIFI